MNLKRKCSIKKASCRRIHENLKTIQSSEKIYIKKTIKKRLTENSGIQDNSYP